MSCSDERESVGCNIQLEKHQCHEYSPFELLFQFVIQYDEKFRKNSDLFGEFKEQFGEEGDSEARLYPMSGRIANVEEGLVSCLVVSECIADDLVLSMNLPEKIEPMKREIADVFCKSAIHNGEQFAPCMFIGYIVYRPRLNQELFYVFECLMSFEVLLFFKTLESHALDKKRKFFKKGYVFFCLDIIRHFSAHFL